jgi:hypothetical protein
MSYHTDKAAKTYSDYSFIAKRRDDLSDIFARARYVEDDDICYHSFDVK